MSNTQRRKTAWNKSTRCDEYLLNLDNMLGASNRNHSSKRKNRFLGWSAEDVINRTNQMFHTDNWLDQDMIDLSYRKNLSRLQRRRENQALEKAIKQDDYENCLMLDRKSMTEHWWYGLAYYW